MKLLAAVIVAVAWSWDTPTSWALEDESQHPLVVSESSSSHHHQLRATATTASTTQQRQEQSTVGTIQGLRWIDADTNQPVVIAGSVWVPVNPNPQFVPRINRYYLPKDLTNLAIEAVVTGDPVGSVVFTFDNDVPLIIENNAPYALCKNIGVDFLPCPTLLPDNDQQAITAQVFSGKDGTGIGSSPIYLTHVWFYLFDPPLGHIQLINADTDVVIGNGFVEGAVIALSQTPSIAFVLDVRPYKGTWNAVSVNFSYDNGIKVHTETSAPFAFPGNSGPDYLGFTPTIGSHTIAATLYSESNLQGQSVVWSATFTVVA